LFNKNQIPYINSLPHTYIRIKETVLYISNFTFQIPLIRECISGSYTILQNLMYKAFISESQCSNSFVTEGLTLL